jgi:hypothetical protein
MDVAQEKCVAVTVVQDRKRERQGERERERERERETNRKKHSASLFHIYMGNLRIQVNVTSL